MEHKDENTDKIMVVVEIPRKDVKVYELKKAAADMKGTEYFQSFHFGTLIKYDRPLIAYKEVIRVLKECLIADYEAFSNIHKGGPYYWLGYAAFLARDFETAVYFMDAATAEDLRENDEIYHNDLKNIETPALLFIQLKGDHPKQAAKKLVELAETRMNELIDTYNSYQGRMSSLPEISTEYLRSKFFLEALKPHNSKWRSLTTALISYVLEYDLRVIQRDLVIDPSSKEPFILHLFKGGLLLESLITLNPNNTPPTCCKTLKYKMKHVHKDLGIPKKLNISTDELQEVIDILSSAETTIEKSFQIAGKVRNTTGHSLGWEVSISQDEYRGLFERIGVSCLHTISALYR